MDLEKLPSSFDVVVIGTGLPEAMVAASLSRIGKSVLHIDHNDYYGGQWATFTFESLLKWADGIQGQDCNTSSGSNAENDLYKKIPAFNSTISNVVIQSFIPDVNCPPVVEETNCSKEEERTENIKTVTKEDDVQTTEEINLPDEITVLPPEKSDEGEGRENATSEKCNKAELVSKPHQIFNPAKQSSLVTQAKIKQSSSDVSLEDFKILSRKFNLDINPKFLFSAGPLVNAILKANISHYSEFQIVNRILTCKDKEIIEVPCNRSDIFSSTFLSMIEKRTLMKFLTLCLDYDSNSPSEELVDELGKPFSEFLQSRRLSENLQKFIIYSIAMVKPSTPTECGLKETCFFLKSLGRYGKSPFIWPLYGVGELPQAFCRMSAVFGSLYCLSRPASSICIENKNCTKVIVGEDEIECKDVVTSRSYLPHEYHDKETKLTAISKAILIIDASVLPSDTEFISFLTIPPLEGKEELVRVIELGPSASACPSGLFVLYLSCSCTESALSDLEDYVKLVTSQRDDETATKPKLLWSLYFNEVESNTDLLELPENLFVTAMPGNSLGFKDAVDDAESIFKKICPDGEFLMAVPNAEDILWDTEPNETSDNKVTSEVVDQSNETRELGEIKEMEETVEDESESPKVDKSTAEAKDDGEIL